MKLSSPLKSIKQFFHVLIYGRPHLIGVRVWQFDFGSHKIWVAAQNLSDALHEAKTWTDEKIKTCHELREDDLEGFDFDHQGELLDEEGEPMEDWSFKDELNRQIQISATFPRILAVEEY